MSKEKEKLKLIPVENPIHVVCPHCKNIITTAKMEGEYIVYRCEPCKWETPRWDFYKIGNPKDKAKDKI